MITRYMMHSPIYMHLWKLSLRWVKCKFTDLLHLLFRRHDCGHVSSRGAEHAMKGSHEETNTGMGVKKMEKMLFLVFAIITFLVQPVQAFGVGDGLALVLFLAIGVIALCALLGFIARKLNKS